MPAWSPLGGEQRDIYGELAWIPNFQVTMSKDNNRNHKNYKEYFDKPRNYHLAASSASAASSEFFKSNAPVGSVARPKRSNSPSRSGILGNTFMDTRHSNSTFDNGKDLLFGTTVNSMAGSKIGGSPAYSTPFILQETKHNKYKIDNGLKKTLQLKDSIPFLRTNDLEYKQATF